jgi:hypothetical protein
MAFLACMDTLGRISAMIFHARVFTSARGVQPDFLCSLVRRFISATTE